VTSRLMQEAEDARRLWSSLHQEVQLATSVIASARHTSVYTANAIAGVAPEHLRLLENVDLPARMAAMNHPWLSTQDPRASLCAFAEMQAIGAGLKNQYPFDADFSTALRRSLGDWQDGVPEAPTPAILNPLQRSAYYAERGFNTSLTDFSDEAFAKTVSQAGLEFEFTSIIIEDDDTEEETCAKRRDASYAHLQRVEFSVRRLIEERMTNLHGDAWIKRLPAPMLKDWRDKRDKAVNSGQQSSH